MTPSKLRIALLALAVPFGACTSAAPPSTSATSPTPASSPAPASAVQVLSVADMRAALQAGGFRAESLAGSRGELRYFVAGDGPPLVLVHGTGSQAGDWYAVAPGLTERYRVVIPDLPGHGESGPAEGPLPVADLAAAIGALLDQVALGQKAVLVGNSLGGWAALLYAVEHPERVERVIGISSSGIFGTLKVPLQPKNRDEARRLAVAIRGTSAPAPSDQELDELLARVAAGPGPRVFAGLRAADFLEGRAAKIAVPVDLVWGEEDGVLEPAYGEKLAGLIPGARFHRLARCGHMPQVWCPAALLERLAALLAAAPAPAP